MFGVTEHRISLVSRVLGGPTEVNVILPPPSDNCSTREFYASGKRFKVLWLLHAGLGDHNDWLRYTDICRHVQGHDVILVMPNGLQSDFTNHPEFADGYMFTDFFFEELMPFIHNWFPASEAPEDNFIAGFSMGDAATMMYALAHPEKFGGIVGGMLKDYSRLEEYRDMSSGEFRRFVEEHPTAISAGYGKPGMSIFQKEVNMVAKYRTVGEYLDSMEHSWYYARTALQEHRLPKVFFPYANNPTGQRAMESFRQIAGELSITDVHYELIEGDTAGFAFCDGYIPKMLEYFGI